MKAQYAILRFAKYKGPEIGHTIFMEDVRWLTGRRKRRPLQLQFFLKFLLDNRSISCYIVSVS